MSLPSWLPLAVILLPVLAAPVTATMYRSRSTQAWVSFACLQVLLVLCLWMVSFLAAGQVPTMSIASAKVLEARFELVLAIDSLSAFVILLLVLAALANVAYYVGRPGLSPGRAAQEPLLLISLGTTMAALAAGNLLTLYAFWQLSIVCFALLAAAGSTGRATGAGVRYFVVNELAALALLLALGVWYGAGAPSDLGGWAAIADPALRGSVGALLLLAGVMASGGFPFHTAITSPGATCSVPMLTYLLSGANAVGLYLLARVTMSQADGPAVLAQAPYVMAALGAGTVMAGGLLALAHDELERVLVSASLVPVGFALIAVAAGGPLALTAILILVVARVLGLSTAVFGLELETHERQAEPVAALSWLGRNRRLLALAGYVLGAATLACVPPLPGFFGAALSLHALFGLDGPAGGLAATFAVVGSLLAAAALVRRGTALLVTGKTGGEGALPSAFSSGTVGTLVVLSVVGSLFPGWWVGTAIAPMVGLATTSAWAELGLITARQTQPVVVWELALTVAILLVPAVVFAATALRRSETAPVAREDAEHSRDYAHLVEALSYTGKPAHGPETSAAYRRWPEVAAWLRVGKYDLALLVWVAVMSVAGFAAAAVRLTSRLLLR